MSTKLSSNIKLSKKQNIAFSMMKNGENIFLTGVAGSGKCLAKNTPIIMFSGEMKMVQDIKTGEYIMGDDSTPRTILSTTFGEDDMYKIETFKGDSYIVNSHHILTFQTKKTLFYNKNRKLFMLKWGDISGTIKYKFFTSLKQAKKYSKTIPLIIDIHVMKCLNKSSIWNKYFKAVYKGITFQEKIIDIDPYILGIYLTCLSPAKLTLSTLHKEIVDYISGYSNRNNLNIGITQTKINNTILFHINLSYLYEKLQKYNLIINKHVPVNYKCNSKQVQLKLLASIIDLNGQLSNNSYNIIQKNKILAENIYFIAKSQGFQASNIEKYCKDEKGASYSYQLITISGKIHTIPVLVTRKKASKIGCENTLVSKIKITYVGRDTYYGFEIDKNHRFLLGNFLVTHNTSCVKLFIKLYKDQKIMGVTSTTGVSSLLFGGTTVHSFLGIGLGTESVEDLTNKISKRSYLRKKWKDLEVLIIDEVSMLSPILFDKLEEIARNVRHNPKPFGGIQLILSGDFCFSGNTKILMYDGSIKLAKTIKIGDVIMGDDETSRIVSKLFRGNADMYKISFPEQEEELIVTGNHTLCLKSIQNPHSNNIIEMTVNNFLSLPQHIQKNLVCYKNTISNWSKRNDFKLENDPWLLGYWLAYKNSLEKTHLSFLGLLDKLDYKPDFQISLNKYENSIPDFYVYSSTENRLKLLAGLLDYNHYVHDRGLKIQTSNKNLSFQIQFICNSVGLRCIVKIFYSDETKNIYDCKIDGDIKKIPFKNRYNVSDNDNDVSLMRIVITKEKNENFYGFEVNENKRFLLSNFTVVHNCQLPCVKSENFCFESKSWNDCIPKENIVYLNEIMRQENEEFQKCLNNVRLGLLPKETRELLESRIGAKLENSFGIKPTRLFPTNYSVDLINEEELDILSQAGAEFYEYKMQTYVYPHVKEKSYTVEKYLKNCSASETIQLCVGAQVMLIYNMDLDGGLANGSRGVVSNFIGDVPVVKFLNGREVIVDFYTWEVEEQGVKILRATQIPLKLAYACTIHKQQGATLDYAEIDLSNLFEYGMAYVALSRTKNLKGLSIKKIDFDTIKAHPKALEFYKNLGV